MSSRFSPRARRLPETRRLPGARRAAVWAAVVATLVTLLALFASVPAGAAPAPPLPGTPAAEEHAGPPDERQQELEREAKKKENERHQHKLEQEEDREAGEKEEAKEQQEKDKEHARKEKRAKQRDFDKRVEGYRKYLTERGDLLSAFKVSDKHGIPITIYEPDLDTGGTFDIAKKLEGLAAHWLFAATVWIIAFSCWLIAWALSWSLASILLHPAEEVSHSLYSQAVLQLGIPSLALTFSGVVAVWHIFFGRRTRGWGELTASTLISALAAASVIAPPSMLLSEREGAVGQARELGLVVAAIVLDSETAVKDDVDARALTRPLTDQVVDTFIVQPSMLISYGRTFTDTCARDYAESRLAQAAWEEALDEVVDHIFRDTQIGKIQPDPSMGISPTKWLEKQADKWAMDKYGTADPEEPSRRSACPARTSPHRRRPAWTRSLAACSCSWPRSSSSSCCAGWPPPTSPPRVCWPARRCSCGWCSCWGSCPAPAVPCCGSARRTSCACSGC